MADLAQLGIEVTTTGVDSASAALDKLRVSAEQCAKATDTLTNSMGSKVRTATGQVTSGFGSATQAVGLMQAALAGLVGGAVVSAISSLNGLAVAIGRVASESIALAMESQRMGIAARVVGENAGWTSTQLGSMASALERANIPTSRADENLTRLAASGLTAAQSTQLLTAAQNLAVPAATTTADALDKLTYAIATGNQYALRSLRVRADFQAALEDEAKAVGKEVEFLDDAEVATARLNAILEAAADYTNVYSQAQDTAATKAQALRVAWEAFEERLGRTLLPDVSNSISGLTDFLNGLSRVMDDIKESQFSDYMKQVADNTDLAGSAAGRLIGFDISGWAIGAANNLMAMITPLGMIATLMKVIAAYGKGGAQRGTETGTKTTLPSGATAYVGGFTRGGNVVDIASLRNQFNANQASKNLTDDIISYGKGLQKNTKALDKEGTARQGIIDELGKARGSARKYNEALAQAAKLPAQQRTDEYAKIAKSLGIPVEGLQGFVSTMLPRAEAGARAQLAAIARRGGGGRGGRTDESQRAIDQAMMEELRARQKLTSDLNEELELKKREIQLELDNHQERLKQGLQHKSISASAAAIASGYYAEAAQHQIALAERDKINEEMKRELENLQTLNSYLDRTTQAEIEIGGSAQHIAELQNEMLARRQEQETKEFQERLRRDKEERGLTDAAAEARTAAFEALKVREKQVQEIRNQYEIIRQETQKKQDAIDIDSELLATRRAAADSSLEQLQIDQQLVKNQYEKKRLDDEEILRRGQINEAYRQTAEYQRAVKELQTLPEQEQNALKATLGNTESIFNRMNSNISGIGDAIKSHDWVKVWSNLEQAIATLVSVMTSTAATVAQKGAAIGGLISGVGGLIGGQAGGFLQGFGSGMSSFMSMGQSLSKLGGALGGIGSFLGGWGGGIIGGLLGGVMSLFGSNKQKDAERRARENQQAQEEAQRLEEIANEKRQLELRLINATAQGIEALAAQRQLELQTVHAENKALLEQVQEAEQRMARYKKVTELEIQYLELSGQAVAALIRQRQEDIKSVDAMLQPLQWLSWAAQDASDALAKATDNLNTARNNLNTAYSTEMTRIEGEVASAHDELAAAYDREATKLNDLISTFSDFSKTLRDFRHTLDISATAGMSPETTYRMTEAMYSDVNRRAQLGNQEAMDQFTTVAEDFRAASQSYYGVSTNYFRDLAKIKADTEKAIGVSDRQVAIAKSQLDALNKLVSGYLDIDGTTISIEDAIKKLQTAEEFKKDTENAFKQLVDINNNTKDIGTALIDYWKALQEYNVAVAANTTAVAALGDAIKTAVANPQNQPSPYVPPDTSYRSTGGDYGEYVRGNPDLYALFQSGTGMARGRSIEEFGMFHWTRYGKNEPRPVRPYQFGGEFAVGGSGGADSQFVGMMASPAEHILIRTPHQIARETEVQERMAGAVETMAEKLDALIYEAKVDKRQRADIHRETKGSFTELRDSFETFKRRAS